MRLILVGDDLEFGIFEEEYLLAGFFEENLSPSFAADGLDVGYLSRAEFLMAHGGTYLYAVGLLSATAGGRPCGRGG